MGLAVLVGDPVDGEGVGDHPFGLFGLLEGDTDGRSLGGNVVGTIVGFIEGSGVVPARTRFLLINSHVLPQQESVQRFNCRPLSNARSLCMLPIPHDMEVCGLTKTYMSCCGKILCFGCVVANLKPLHYTL